MFLRLLFCDAVGGYFWLIKSIFTNLNVLQVSLSNPECGHETKTSCLSRQERIACALSIFYLTVLLFCNM